MKRITAADPESHSADLVADNIAEIGRLFPEAVAEGKVDFAALRDLLGDAVDDSDEKYGLTWHGKSRARKLAAAYSTGTLRPCPEESVAWDSTRNMVIEGDNLEVLKLLRRSYTNKVKFIYIDPPYNTGKDFVYRDKYKDGIRTYLKTTGQLDGNGDKLCSNGEASGRFHTNWLNMMYPRLKVARALLRQDGIIAVSIDQGELSNLQNIMDELWGEENRFAILTRRAMHTVRNSSKDFNLHADYLLVYGRNKAWFEESPERYIRQRRDKWASYPHDDGDGRGPYKLDPLHARNPYTRYVHKFESGVVWEAPNGSFPRYAPETLVRMERENQIVFGRGAPKAKRYLAEVQQGVPPDTILSPDDVGFNAEGTRELRDVMGADKVFSQPKPTRLIRYLLDLTNDPDAIVVDFFGGSGTTGHAVVAENLRDNGRRRYFVVQLPEPVDEKNNEQKTTAEFLQAAGKPLTVAELTKERLRRVRAISTSGATKEAGDVDFGFRVFKLDSSNIRAWEPERNDLAGSVLDYVDHVKPDRSENDLFYELLLKFGYDLCVPVEQREMAGKRVRAVGNGELVTCLAESIKDPEVDELVKGIVAWRDEMDEVDDFTVVFRESAFEDDIAKSNVVEILGQYDIKDVRSL